MAPRFAPAPRVLAMLASDEQVGWHGRSVLPASEQSLGAAAPSLAGVQITQ